MPRPAAALHAACSNRSPLAWPGTTAGAMPDKMAVASAVCAAFAVGAWTTSTLPTGSRKAEPATPVNVETVTGAPEPSSRGASPAAEGRVVDARDDRFERGKAGRVRRDGQAADIGQRRPPGRGRRPQGCIRGCTHDGT